MTGMTGNAGHTGILGNGSDGIKANATSKNSLTGCLPIA
jgi:hypothetical protein